MVFCKKYEFKLFDKRVTDYEFNNLILLVFYLVVGDYLMFIVFFEFSWYGDFFFFDYYGYISVFGWKYDSMILLKE